jgi:hypothetical protein
VFVLPVVYLSSLVWQCHLGYGKSKYKPGGVNRAFGMFPFIYGTSNAVLNSLSHTFRFFQKKNEVLLF